MPNGSSTSTISSEDLKSVEKSIDTLIGKLDAIGEQVVDNHDPVSTLFLDDTLASLKVFKFRISGMIGQQSFTELRELEEEHQIITAD